MARKSGDLQKAPALSMSDITKDFSLSLAKSDERLQCFLNYKPVDKLMQPDGFFTDARKTQFLFGGNKCLKGDSKIYDPVAGITRRLDSIQGDFHVLAFDGEKMVIAKANQPFVKGFGDLHRYHLSSGQSFVSTPYHRVMLSQTASPCVAKPFQKGDVYRRESTSDTCQQARSEDDQNCLKTTLDLKCDCRMDFHSDDELSQHLLETVQSLSPLRSYVPIHTYRYCQSNCASSLQYRSGDLACKDTHNRSCSLCGHLSSRDVGRHCEDQSLKHAQAETFLCSFQPTSPSFCIYGQPRRSERLFSEVQQIAQSQLALLSPHCDESLNRPYSTSDLELITYTDIFITSEMEECKDYIWDFNVEVYHNYFYAGVIHHNSSKTTAAVFKAIMIYTGIIPPSMVGVYAHELSLRDIAVGGKHHRPRMVRIIVMSFADHWPMTIRPLLLGDPKEGGVGMLPEQWSNWDPQEHIFSGPDGSQLQIFSCAPDENSLPRGLRGPPLDHTLQDEWNREDIYAESLTRGVSLKHGPRTVDIVICPQEGTGDWTYKTFYCSNYDPSTKRKFPRARQHPDINATQVDMRDNPSISQGEINAIVSSLKEYEVAFRVWGEYSSKTSDNYFDMDIMIQWEAENRTNSPGVPCRILEDEIDESKGAFMGTLKPVEGPCNERADIIWRVYEAPKHGDKYIITADIAEGNKIGDFTSITCWNATDQTCWYEVATLRTRTFKPGELAIQAAVLSKIYGGKPKHKYCLIAPEKNAAGVAFVDRLRNHKNIYRRVREEAQLDEQTDTIGWYTGEASKPKMLADMHHAMRKMYQCKVDVKVNDKIVKASFCPFKSEARLQEFMGYEERIIRSPSGVSKTVYGARKGSNDDTVMDTCIAARIIQKEYSKITACVLTQKEETLYPNMSIIDAALKKEQEAMRRQSSTVKRSTIRQLKEKFYGKHR